MQKVFIIYRTFYDTKGENFTVGGIQTYIRLLVNTIKQKNLKPVIVQFGDVNFKKKYNGIDVFGVDVKVISNERKKAKVLLEFIKQDFQEHDLLLFATEDLYIPTFTQRVLAIQHGVIWDKPLPRQKVYILELLRKSIISYKHLLKTRKLKNLVCVDYNYTNWVRTQVCYVDKNIYNIPNSTVINKEEIIKENNLIKIIFARRFEEYRGTRLFAKVIKKILKNHDNVHVTFAGKGTDESYLKNLFQEHSRVEFITYDSEKSLEIHRNFHISVIPTLGSEGTSLSLLEAMASKCAVIATNVGGMTNIILDHYNGLLIPPNEVSLYEAIESLVIDEKLRLKLAENAYLTVNEAFNISLWKKRWGKVLDDMIIEK